MDNVLIIDWIIRITSLVAIIIGVVVFLSTNKIYEENVLIKRINNPDDSQDVHFLHIFNDTLYGGEFTFFKGNGCTLKNIRIYETDWENNRLVDKKCLYEIKKLPPNEGVLFEIYYAEGIQCRRLEWQAPYGTIGKHNFTENGFNGNVDVSGYTYQYNLINRFRRIFNIK